MRRKVAAPISRHKSTSRDCGRSPLTTSRPKLAHRSERFEVGPLPRGFALLRPIADMSAQERIRDLVLQAYAEYEQETASEAAS